MTQHLPDSDTIGEVVPGVADQIERGKLIEMFKLMGIDPKELYSMTVYPEGVEVEIYALKNGSRYWVTDKDGEPRVAKHRLSIPIRP